MADASHTLLFATRTSPFAGESGSGTYVADLLQYLSTQGFRIHVVWTEPPDLLPSKGWYTPPADAGSNFSLEIVDMVKVGRRFFRPSVVWLPLKARSFHLIKTFLRTVGLWRRTEPVRTANPGPSLPAWGSDATPHETRAIRAAISRCRPDVVIANYAWVAPAIRPAGSTSPKFAVLTHDVRHRQLHLRDGRLIEQLGEHMSIEEESRMLASADTLIAIQQPEAAVFSRMFPGKNVLSAPMSVGLHASPPPREPVLLFVGSDHGPNRDGLQWFLRDVWPVVHRDVPAARLLVAGGICRVIPEPLPGGVTKLGRVPDLATAYAQASVVIAPIFQGSGIKIKLLEAIGFGRACVTTSVGLEGLEALRHELRIADSAVEFARATTGLLRDPDEAARLGTALQAQARVHLSREACYQPVARELHALAVANSPKS
ncbi:MAG TPA: glycosyltransferase [Opitutaceae bacterium]|nr:glycosyltransferase [Opitutaceae bacterium]